MRAGKALAAALIACGALGFFFVRSSRTPAAAPVSAEQALEPVAEPPPTHPAPSHSPVLEPQRLPTPAPAPKTSGETLEKPGSEEEYWAELEALEQTDKQRALSYALAGDEWYEAVGKPAEARRAKIITLLVDLGQMSEARARTREYIQQYPNGTYVRLVQGVTGIHPRPGPPPHRGEPRP